VATKKTLILNQSTYGMLAQIRAWLQQGKSRTVTVAHAVEWCIKEVDEAPELLNAPYPAPAEPGEDTAKTQVNMDSQMSLRFDALQRATYRPANLMWELLIRRGFRVAAEKLASTQTSTDLL